MYDWEQRELERQARLKQQMKEQDKRRFEDPDKDLDLSKVWVVYQWQENNKQWNLAGFRRRRNRRKPQTMNRFFAKVRRKLEIRKDIPVMMLDLQTARLLSLRADKTWLHQPPERQLTLRPVLPVPRIPKAPKRKVTRYRKDVSLMFHKKYTKFIALGRNAWDRDPGYLYIGPLKADTLSAAKREAAQHPLCNDVRVVPVPSLSKTLRNAMHRARKVRPGLRLRWPEPAPLQSLLGMPAMALRAVSRADIAYHIEQAERVVRRAAKSKKDKTAALIDALAVLMFLYDFVPDITAWRAA